MDVCYVDEAGFALTQPTTTTWGAVGCPRLVPYEAPQGRRLNVIGGYFTHGPAAGTFQFDTFAKLPALKGTPSPEARAGQAAAQGLELDEVGALDSEVFVGFVWQLAGRPLDAPPNWRRERPLVVVVDNYSVHTSERVRLERRALERADVYLLYLPAYSPELSRIEPLWKIIKYHELRQRSFRLLGELKAAVEAALVRLAVELRRTDHLIPRTP